MTDNAALSATFIAIAAGTLIWVTLGVIVRLRRHRKTTSAKTRGE